MNDSEIIREEIDQTMRRLDEHLRQVGERMQHGQEVAQVWACRAGAFLALAAVAAVSYAWYRRSARRRLETSPDTSIRMPSFDRIGTPRRAQTGPVRAR